MARDQDGPPCVPEHLRSDVPVPRNDPRAGEGANDGRRLGQDLQVGLREPLGVAEPDADEVHPAPDDAAQPGRLDAVPKSIARQVYMRVKTKPALAKHSDPPRGPVMGRGMGEVEVRSPTRTLGRTYGGIQPE